VTVKPEGGDLDHLGWLGEHQLTNWQGKSILDLGCRSGYLCQEAMVGGARAAVGVDVVTPADLELKDRKWSFLQVDLDCHDWQKKVEIGGPNFDLILAFDILEHLQSPWHFLRACKGLLEPSGTIVLTTPNVNSWQRLLKPNGWSGATDDQHKTLFGTYSLGFLLKRMGFEVATMRAPLRSLSFLGPMQPQVGGQIFCVARNHAP